MPSQRRSEVFLKDEVRIYHAYNQVVRQDFLLGICPLTNRDRRHRKGWLRKESRRLARYMAIDVLDYGFLDTHLHEMLRNRPDIVSLWTDNEVVMRWWQLCPRRRKKDGSPGKPRKSEIARLRGMVDELRERLSDISWFMRLLCQRIAIRANKADGVKGPFFAGRFKLVRLDDEASVLRCSMYINLNAVRARIVETPEASLFTSVHERIQARWEKSQRELGIQCVDFDVGDEFNGDWLSAVFIDERADAYVSMNDLPTANTDEGNVGGVTVSKETYYNPVGSGRVSNRGYLAVPFHEYLKLLDLVGRELREDKRGAIPKTLPPILERLGISGDALEPWIDETVDYIHLRASELTIPPAYLATS